MTSDDSFAIDRKMSSLAHLLAICQMESEPEAEINGQLHKYNVWPFDVISMTRGERERRGTRERGTRVIDC